MPREAYAALTDEVARRNWEKYGNPARSLVIVIITIMTIIMIIIIISSSSRSSSSSSSSSSSMCATGRSTATLPAAYRV